MSQISQKAADMLEAWISKHGTDDKQALIDYAYSLTGRYGQAAGALACQMYEATAAAQGVVVQTAEMAELPERWEVAKAVQGTMKQSQAKIPDTTARLVKQVGADTTLKNARRDGAQFAWIPHGDTCAFCITLASRGWQDISKNALRNGHAEHIHANCDCEYAVRFDGHSTVAGYDPEKYLEEYNAAGGDINAMRRARYAENKDKINAQKRAAYAERVEKRHTNVIIGLDNDRYTIAEPKISQFLLKPGAKHSAEFFDVGYSDQDGALLNTDIYHQFDESLKTDIRVTEDGAEKFSIFMELGKDKKRVFRTVWQCDPGSKKPRLITAHREDKK